MLELRKINSDNYEECLNLLTTDTSVEFVDSVEFSLAEAWVFYEESRPFAIYADNVMVGFVLNICVKNSMHVGFPYQLI